MLRDPEQRAALLTQLRDVGRLVLLGDILELRHGPLREALVAAREPLREIGAALPSGAEVVIVPGNHDHYLAAPWLQRRARKPPPDLGLEAAVDWRPGEALATVVRLLGGGNVRAAYPGVWLRDDVYALHGHYCDRHTTVPMLERLAAGTMARIVHEPAGGPRRAEDYEAVLAPVYAWLFAVAQAGGLARLGDSSHGPSASAWSKLSSGRRRRTLRRRVMAAGFPALVAAVNRARLGPVRSNLSGGELRRAALLATHEALARLGVGARHVIFGHTHRAGPLRGDDLSEWGSAGRPQLVNTGCWVNEPQFLGHRPHESPYRPGFVALLDSEGPPELRCLLD